MKSLMLLLLVIFTLVGCGSAPVEPFGDRPDLGTGGSDGGGDVGDSGPGPAAGGSQNEDDGGSGGEEATGGASSGGANTGGARPSTGGKPNTGGAPATGGSPPSTGGAATGGQVVGTGGAGTGGAWMCPVYTHDNGFGGTWKDCTPLGIYNENQAMEACDAAGAVTCRKTNCGVNNLMVCGYSEDEKYVYGCWSYLGDFAGQAKEGSDSCSNFDASWQ